MTISRDALRDASGELWVRWSHEGRGEQHWLEDAKKKKKGFAYVGFAVLFLWHLFGAGTRSALCLAQQLTR